MNGDKEKISKVIDRVKKLLALASDKANEHESALAAIMAAKMMEEYNLAMADVIEADLKKNKDNLVDEPISEVVYNDRFPSWFQQLSCCISRVFDCHVKFDYFYEEGNYQGKRRIKIFGYKPDVEVSKYVFSFVLGQIERLTEEAWAKISDFEKRYISALSWKKSYREGLVSRLSLEIKTLYKKEDIKTSSGTSLVVVKEINIIEKYGNFSYKTGNHSVGNYNAYQQGQKDASKINLRKVMRSESRETAKSLR